MTALVIYESMYGNTRSVAEAIAAGVRTQHEVHVVPIGQVRPDEIRSAELVVVGGPTHVHTLSRRSTRRAAAEAAEKPGSGLRLEPSATGPGVREWVAAVEPCPVPVVTFDTRLRAPALVTGRASKGMARQLRRKGFTLLAPPQSFLVTKANTLVEGEFERARQWGMDLAARVATTTVG